MADISLKVFTMIKKNVYVYIYIWCSMVFKHQVDMSNTTP